jgi:hypothetical protein
MANTNSGKHRCLRHQMKPSPSYCAMCEAKTMARGATDKARRIFIEGESRSGCYRVAVGEVDGEMQYIEEFREYRGKEICW